MLDSRVYLFLRSGSFLALILLFLLAAGGKAQTLDCQTRDAETDRSTGVYDCDHYIPALPTTGCDNYVKFAPVISDQTPIKTVQLVYHVFQKDDGSRNFQNTVSDLALLNQVAPELNNMYGNAASLSHTDPACIPTYIQDTRIRFSVAQILFHQDSDVWPSAHDGNHYPSGCDVYDQYVTNNFSLSAALKKNAIHIFIMGCRKQNADGSGAEVYLLGGYASGIPSHDKNFIVVKGWYNLAVEKTIPEPWQMTADIATNLGHELGHSMGLFHAFAGDQCCDTYSNGVGGTNNIMDYGNGRGFTECQIARMHYFLYGKTNSDIYRVDMTNYCAKDDSYDVVIPPGSQTWDIDKRMTTDIVLQTGAELIIKCKLGMPSDGNIIVNRGARLIIDGGTITHNRTMSDDCSSGQWGSIYVFGNTSYAHSPLMQSASFSLVSSGPGIVLVKNGSLIEYGRHAISTSSVGIPWPTSDSYWGGFVYAENSTFRNNHRSAAFMQYPFPSFNAFINCSFENLDGTANTGVTDWACNNILFDACVFVGMPTSAITTYDAGVTITRSSFDSNHRGVDAVATMPLSSDIQVGGPLYGNEFFNNDVGIYANAINRLNVSSNQFTENPFGVAINGLSQYIVSDNHFRSNSAAIDIVQTGAMYNFIGCNIHEKDFYGIDASGNNKGVQFINQEFDATHDVILTNEGVDPGAFTFQGSSGYARYNLFSSIGPRHINTVGSTLSFQYFYPNPAINPRLKPKCAANDVGICIAYNNYLAYQTNGTRIDCSGEEPPKEGGDLCLTEECLEEIMAQIAELESELDFVDDEGVLASLKSRASRIIWGLVNESLDQEQFEGAIRILEQYRPDAWREAVYGALMRSGDYEAALEYIKNYEILSGNDQFFVDVQTLNLGRLRGEIRELNEVQLALLRLIADTDEPASAFAKGLLALMTGDMYEPELTDLTEERAAKQPVSGSLQSKFKIYPNPARDLVTLTFHPWKDLGSSCDISVEIYNLLGQMISKEHMGSEGFVTLDVKAYREGAFMAILKEDGKVIHSEKFNVLR